MRKLTKMDRDDLQMKLEQHDILTKIEAKIGKRGIFASINTSNTYDDSDFESVSIDNKLAKIVVKQQREAVEKVLAGYGVSVK